MARRRKSELNGSNLIITYYRCTSYSQIEASIYRQRELAYICEEGYWGCIQPHGESTGVSADIVGG